MATQQYVEKPYKVRAEQYAASASPPSPLVCHCTVTPLFPTGAPHVHTATGIVAPINGDWIVQDVWSPHAVTVVPAAEFTDRFGGGAVEDAE